MRLRTILLSATTMLVVAGCNSGANSSANTEPPKPVAEPSKDVTSKTPPPQPEAELKSTDLKVGTGKTAATGDLVYMEYTGKLTSGKVFDSNVGKVPYSLTLGAGSVIQGWDKGIVGMKVGGVRRLIIPPKLAYGDNPMGDIPPNSTLDFEVKLLGLVKSGEEMVFDPIDLSQGSGRAAKSGDTVSVKYRGTLVNGKEFDSSSKHPAPLSFKIGAGEVVSGLEEGVKGMRVGGKRKLILPPATAYGAGSPGGDIPPNSILVFEVELLSIK